MKIIRCVQCRVEFSRKELEKSTNRGDMGCPSCKTVGIPMEISEDAAININWHELRILSIWAERWASHCEAKEGNTASMLKVVYCIIKELQEQHNDKAPLSMSGEIKQLKEEYGEVEVTGNISGEGPLPPKSS